MSSSPTLTTVDPRDNVGQLVVWSIFNLAGSFGNLVLFVVGLCIPRIRKNPLLLNLHFVVFFNALFWAFLVVSGEALNEHPRFGHCLVSAAGALTFADSAVGSGLALVTKIWASIMLVHYPNVRFLRALTWTPWLLALPYVSFIGMFFASIAVGLHDRSTVFRGSPFYCTIDNDILNLVSPVISGLYSLITLVLAIWTTVLVARSRRRVRSPHNKRIRNLSLVVRTLFFSILMFIGFVCGIIAIFIGFTVVWVDIVISFTSLWAFLVFLTDKDNMYMLFRCRRSAHSTMSTTEPTGVSVSKQTHIRRDGISHADAELVTFPPSLEEMDEQKRGAIPMTDSDMHADNMYDVALQEMHKKGRPQDDWELPQP